MFDIYRVKKEDAVASEPLGTKPKFWYLDVERRMLFKADERGTGEDWAEKISCHLCELLGLPHVHYELAELFEGGQYVRPGVICENCAPPPTQLFFGNQLLSAADSSYAAGQSKKYKVRKHTPQFVAQVLQLLVGPPAERWMSAAPPGMRVGCDVFVGYVMLDAWIANQDRHHQNWGALTDGKSGAKLAPTFDHGAALARNLTEDERQERLTTKDKKRTVSAFAARARSAFYGQETDRQPLGTLEAFSAFARCAPDAARTWLDRLKAVDPLAVRSILDEVPEKRMSRIAKDFTLQLLLVNQKRLLEGRTVV